MQELIGFQLEVMEGSLPSLSVTHCSKDFVIKNFFFNHSGSFQRSKRIYI